MFRHILCAATIVGSLFAIPPVARAATQHAQPCASGSLWSMASRTHAKLTPCVAKPHALILETTYYQNASRVGGTALAAFPEARVRYGALADVELFVDAPSEIAKSGQRGAGIYFMTQTGVGAKYQFARAHDVVYSISAETHPPLGALANLNLIPLSDVHLSANWSGYGGREFGLEAGTINYDNLRHTHLRSSELIAATYTQAFNTRTWWTAEVTSQSNVYSKSRAQSSGVFSVSRMLSSRMLFGAEIGSAFNAQSDSKPHYIAGTFTIR
ncbi:MAG TPA: hypothetical protein VFN49_01350 [Candidatus Aquilonibacter sp.]|nr:hypothetical protein [Candidatus Aquilonibacter sp.]